MTAAVSALASAPVAIDNAMLALQQRRDLNAAKMPEVKNAEGIKKAAEEFEGMFLAEMLSHMFSGMEVDPEFGGGHGEEMFRGMLTQEYGKQIARGPGLGISDQLQRTLLQMQQGK
jgi:Rod binding domain-containing protein